MEPRDRANSVADEVIDELMPSELDWRAMVRRYPLAALLLAGVGGYVLGRSRGTDILSSLSNFAADTLTDNVNELLGKNVL